MILRCFAHRYVGKHLQDGVFQETSALL